jgi:hypothetical protein
MYLSTGSFEAGLGSWRAVNNAGAVSATVVTDRNLALQGDSFMRVRTLVADGSVAHDFTIFSGSAAAPRSLVFSVWLRAAPGAGPIAGVVALWDLGANRSTDTSFQVANQWMQVATTLDGVFQVDPSKYPITVRAEIYINTVGQSLDVDGASLV